MSLMNAEVTPRGFELLKFKDIYNIECTVQQSSIFIEDGPAGSSALWVGVASDRMHLDRERVAELIKVMQNWLNTGSLIERKPNNG